MSTALSQRPAESSLGRPLPPRSPLPRRRRRSRWWNRLRRGYQAGEVSRRLLVGTPLAAVGFAIWAFGGVYGWAYGTAYLLIFGSLAAWCIQCLRGRLRASWHWVYVPLLMFGLVVMSQYWGHGTAVAASTATAFFHLSAAGVLFLVVSQCFRSDRDVAWIAASFAVFTAALALLAILQTLTASNGIYWHFTYAYASPAGSFVNRNHFSGCMEMLVPVACLEAYRRRRRAWIYFLPWTLAPGLGVAAILVVASRGGAVSLAAEATAAVFVVLYLGRRHPTAQETVGGSFNSGVAEAPGWLPLPLSVAKPLPVEEQGAPGSSPPPVGMRRLAALLAACALTLSLVAVIGTDRLQARLETTNSHAPSVTQRAELNASSWTMFRRRPGLGWGLGTWADIYPIFTRFPDTAVFAYAHNDYLQLLAETGVAGAGCALLFWGLWGWEFRRNIAASRSGQIGSAAAALVVAAAIACLGILVHSWVDFNLHIPANLLLFFAMAAFAISSPYHR